MLFEYWFNFTLGYKMNKEFYRKILSPFKSLFGFVLDRNINNTILQMEIDREIDRLITQCKTRCSDSPICSGFKGYSQVDEDGIIENIFRRIGENSKIFCEIGSSSGLENNTHYLLLKGWRGIWMEGSLELTNFVKEHLKEVAPDEDPTLCLVNDYITKGNINTLIKNSIEVGNFSLSDDMEIDFLSIDIDGNDLEVLEAIDFVKPRVLCVEYNAKFVPPLNLTIKYNDSHRWESDDYHGASLSAFVDMLTPKGYTLVSCNVSGANAFFVRSKEIEGNFELYDVKDLYMPAKFGLTMKKSGHAPTLKFIRNFVTYKSV